MNDTTTKREPGAQGELYDFLLKILPGHRTSRNILDVRRLTRELDRSHEAIYRWLRKDSLKPDNAQAIWKLANLPANVKLLTKEGRKPPSMRDFDVFVYAA